MDKAYTCTQRTMTPRIASLAGLCLGLVLGVHASASAGERFEPEGPLGEDAPSIYERYIESNHKDWAHRMEKLFEYAAPETIDPTGRQLELFNSGLKDFTTGQLMHEGESLLYHTCKLNADPRFAAAILDKGAEIDWRDDEGRTPLMINAMMGPEPLGNAVASTLIERGADVDLVDTQGMNALMHAARLGRSAGVVRLLAAKTKDIDARDGSSQGMTALMYAAQHATFDSAFDAFIARKADLEIAQHGSGLRALHLAAVHNTAANVERLVKAGAELESEARGGVTPLMAAAVQSKHPEVILKLIELGASVTAAADPGHTVVHMAAMGDQPAAVFEALARAGADLNAPLKSGQTPKMLIAQHGTHPGVWAVLSRSGIDLNATPPQTPPLLMTAIDAGRSTAFIAAMIDAGCDVNARFEAFKTTPLQLAAGKTQDPGLVELLLDAGADVHARNIQGESVLDYAAKNPALEGHPVMERLREMVGD